MSSCKIKKVVVVVDTFKDVIEDYARVQIDPYKDLNTFKDEKKISYHFHFPYSGDNFLMDITQDNSVYEFSNQPLDDFESNYEKLELVFQLGGSKIYEKTLYFNRETYIDSKFLNLFFENGDSVSAYLNFYYSEEYKPLIKKMMSQDEAKINAELNRKKFLAPTTAQLLHSEESYRDFEIKVGQDVFKVHKCILASQSSVFKRILKTNNHYTYYNINYPFNSVDVVKQVIHYLYFGELDNTNLGVSDHQILIGLFSFAHKYEIESLTVCCLKFAFENREDYQSEIKNKILRAVAAFEPNTTFEFLVKMFGPYSISP